MGMSRGCPIIANRLVGNLARKKSRVSPVTGADLLLWAN
jgi:hypothetical protein